MRIITWNLNARVRSAPAQVAALAALCPDVIALQEVTPGSWAVLRPALVAAGFEALICSLDSHPRPGLLPRVAALAAREPLLPCSPAPLVPAPEVCLAATLDDIAVVSLHVPTRVSAYGGQSLKLGTQEGTLAWLDSVALPVVVAGDLNAPKAETGPGDVLAFSSRRDLRSHAAELGFHTHPVLIDAFRACHGYDRQDISWAWKNRGRTGGYRLDHILASPALRPTHCEYDHEHRLSGLSDHSPMVADFALA
ncbi:MAG: endonuclease/exonuclease/phosphatase family protein [Dehalococcoidia bacterium]